MKVIELDGITKSFRFARASAISGMIKNSHDVPKKDTIKALDNISFSVDQGEMIGIIGRNGSGKTTLLRIIAGIYKQDLGEITVNGKVAPILQLGIGFNKELNAKENITIYGLLLGLSKEEIRNRFAKIIEFAELQDFANMELKHYSAGMRARLAFSTALEVDPDILLVDEILAVGDQAFKEKSFDAFIKFKEQKKTIVYTSHNIRRMAQLSDRMILLDHGKLVAIGKPDETVKRYEEILKTKVDE